MIAQTVKPHPANSPMFNGVFVANRSNQLPPIKYAPANPATSAANVIHCRSRAISRTMLLAVAPLTLRMAISLLRRWISLFVPTKPINEISSVTITPTNTVLRKCNSFSYCARMTSR